MILSEEVNLFHFYSLHFQHFTSLTPVPPLPPSVHFLLLISSHCPSFDSHLLRVSPSLRCITELPSDVIIRCPGCLLILRHVRPQTLCCFLSVCLCHRFYPFTLSTFLWIFFHLRLSAPLQFSFS